MMNCSNCIYQHSETNSTCNKLIYCQETNSITSSTSKHKRINMSAMESDSPTKGGKKKTERNMRHELTTEYMPPKSVGSAIHLPGTGNQFVKSAWSKPLPNDECTPLYRKPTMDDEQSHSKKGKKKNKLNERQELITKYVSPKSVGSAIHLPGTGNQLVNSAWSKPLPKAASAPPGLGYKVVDTYIVPDRPQDSLCSLDRKVTNKNLSKGLDSQQCDNSQSIHTQDQAEETHSRINFRNTTSKLPIALSSAESQQIVDYSDADVYQDINDIGSQQSDNYQSIHTKDQSEDPCHPSEHSKKVTHSRSREHSKGHDKSPHGHSREISDDHQEIKRDHSRDSSKGLHHRELFRERPTTNTQFESVPGNSSDVARQYTRTDTPVGDSGQGARPKIVWDQTGNAHDPWSQNNQVDQSEDPCHSREHSKKAKPSRSWDSSKGCDKSPRRHSKIRSDDHPERIIDHSRDSSKGLHSHDRLTTNAQIESVLGNTYDVSRQNRRTDTPTAEHGQGARLKIRGDPKWNVDEQCSQYKDHTSQKSHESVNSNWRGCRSRGSIFDKNYGKDEHGRPGKEGKRSQPGDEQPQVQEPGSKKAAKAIIYKFGDLKIKSREEYIYHYTNLRGYRGIKRDMQIKSFARDKIHARMGIGVYFTGLPPETSTNTILQTCYFHTKFQSKADYYVKINRADVQSKKHSDRNIYCVKGAEGVNLNIVPHEFGNRITQQSLATSRQLSYGSLLL